jgi:hypothetical protein
MESCRLLALVAVASAVGATAAELYAVLCAGLDLLMGGHVWQVAATSGGFALCGGVTGALVAIAGVIEWEDINISRSLRSPAPSEVVVRSQAPSRKPLVRNHESFPRPSIGAANPQDRGRV